MTLFQQRRKICVWLKNQQYDSRALSLDAHHVLHVYKMLKNITLEAEKNVNKIKSKTLEKSLFVEKPRFLSLKTKSAVIVSGGETDTGKAQK